MYVHTQGMINNAGEPQAKVTGWKYNVVGITKPRLMKGQDMVWDVHRKWGLRKIEKDGGKKNVAVLTYVTKMDIIKWSQIEHIKSELRNKWSAILSSEYNL